MTNDETPLSHRILAALGGMRDAMTPEDVKAVQRFARAISEAEGAHAEIRFAEAWRMSHAASGTLAYAAGTDRETASRNKERK